MNDVGMELQKHALDTWQVIRNRIGLILLSFLLVFSVAAILTYIMPRKYKGRVEMKIERLANKVPIFDRSTNDPLALSDTFFKTEFESITKLETLYPVLDELDLSKKWDLPSRQMAMSKLRANLDTQAAVRSDFVVIEFYDEDPKLAAEVANAVATSYMNTRLAVESEQKVKALELLNSQIGDQQKRAVEARMKAQQAKKAAGIVGEYVTGNMATRTPGARFSTPEENMELTRSQELYKSDMEVQALKSEIAELEKLKGDELVSRAAALKLDNPLIIQLYTDYQKLVVEREGLTKAGLGKRHPTIQSIDARLETNKQIIQREAEDHLNGLRTRFASAEKRRAEMEQFNEESKNDVLDKQSAYDQYLVAQRELEGIEAILVQLKTRYFEEEADHRLSKSPATVWQKAEPEARPSKPNVPLNLALGGIVGLMFGLGLAFFLEYMDTTVKSLDDVERHLGVPVLAVIPKDVGVLHRSTGFNPDAEAYRILRTNIEFNRRNTEANCLTVVSGGAGEGKSTTLVNLAFVCAQGGYNVLLIDGDLRRPSLHKLFDVSHSVGLTNYLTTNVQLEDVVIRTPVENLYFLPSGLLPADSAGVLNSQRMSELVADVKSRFDLVLIDSPPILGVSDASVLANEADMTIIVVQHRKLPRHMLMRVKQAVENVGGNVLGVVLNNVDVRSDSQYQYYTSYYTYYSPNNSPTSPAGAQKQGRRKEKRSRAVAHGEASPNSESKGMAGPAAGRDGDDVF